MSDKPTYSGKYVKLVAEEPVSRTAQLIIGDQMIPFYEVTVKLSAGKNIELTATVPAQSVDITALQEDTKVVVVDLRPNASDSVERAPF